MIRSMKSASLRFCSAALLSSAAAIAQTMDFACPDPGTTFTYDSGTKVVAKGRDGMDCIMEIVGGKPYKLRALLFDNPSPDGRDMSAFIAALRPGAAVAARSRQEDRGALQRRRPDLELRPDRGALREAHRPGRTP